MWATGGTLWHQHAKLVRISGSHNLFYNLLAERSKSWKDVWVLLHERDTSIFQKKQLVSSILAKDGYMVPVKIIQFSHYSYMIHRASITIFINSMTKMDPKMLNDLLWALTPETKSKVEFTFADLILFCQIINEVK